MPQVRLGGEDLHKKQRKQTRHNQVNLLFNLILSAIPFSANHQNCPYQQESKKEDDPILWKFEQQVHTQKTGSNYKNLLYFPQKNRFTKHKQQTRSKG
jgi:hypothetical protein